MSLSRALLAISSTVIFPLAGCAAAPPPPAAAPVAAAPARPVDPGPSRVESEIGGMSDDEVSRAFQALRGDLEGCFAGGAGRVAALGGHLKLRLRVGRDGAVKWAYLGETTLGDRETEKCILARAKEKTWPKPLGGDGLIEQSFDFDAQVPFVAWNEKRAEGAAGALVRSTRKCRSGIRGGFVATAYVRPDGRVLAAGVAPPSEKGEDAADCVVDAVRRLRFGPVAKVAKVSFEIR